MGTFLDMNWTCSESVAALLTIYARGAADVKEFVSETAKFLEQIPARHEFFCAGVKMIAM